MQRNQASKEHALWGQLKRKLLTDDAVWFGNEKNQMKRVTCGCAYASLMQKSFFAKRAGGEMAPSQSQFAHRKVPHENKIRVHGPTLWPSPLHSKIIDS